MKPCRLIDDYWFTTNEYFWEVQYSHYSVPPGFRHRRDERKIKLTPQCWRCRTELFKITADLGRDTSSRRITAKSYRLQADITVKDRTEHFRTIASSSIQVVFSLKKKKHKKTCSEVEHFWRQQSQKIKPPNLRNPVRTDRLLATFARLVAPVQTRN